MAFKSTEQPLCRWCAKLIKKHTMTVHIAKEPASHHGQSSFSRYVYPDVWPMTKADCQKLTNQNVVSVKRHHSDDGRISSFGEWDGESYDDQFFCSGPCARSMGYAACAGRDMASKAWIGAMRKRHETKAEAA